MHDGVISDNPDLTYKALEALRSLAMRNANAFSANPLTAWHYATVYDNTVKQANGVKVDGPVAVYLDDRYQDGCFRPDCHQTWHERVEHSGGYRSRIITFDCEDALGADCGYALVAIPNCTYDIGIIMGKRIAHAVGRLNGVIRDLCVPGGMPGKPEYEKTVWLRMKG